MLRFRSFVLGVGLMSLLAIAGSAVVAGSASAGPVYSFCHKVAAGTGTFTDAACSVSGAGNFVLTYADTATTLLVCEAVAKGKYETALCNKLQTNGPFEKVLTTKFGGTPLLTGKGSGTQTLVGTVAGAKIEINCNTLKFSTQPEEFGKSTGGKLTYTSCSVPKPPKCAVKEPIVATFNDQLEVEGGQYIDKFTGAEAGEKFAEIEFINKGAEVCSLNTVVFTVTGSQKCAGETLAQAEVVTLKHTIECKTTKSNLKIGAIAATYEGKSLAEPANGDAWAILLEV